MSLCINSLRMIAKRSISMGAPLSSGSGSGAGKGGGTGGAIRDAGGKFGEMEAAQENAYFRKLEAQQLAALARKHDDEIKHHEKEIQRHLDAIKRHRESQDDLKKADKKKKDD